MFFSVCEENIFEITTSMVDLLLIHCSKSDDDIGANTIAKFT